MKNSDNETVAFVAIIGHIIMLTPLTCSVYKELRVIVVAILLRSFNACGIVVGLYLHTNFIYLFEILKV